SVMSLPRHSEDASSPPRTPPRRRSARSRNATVDRDVLVIVTVVTRFAPAGPRLALVDAVAETAPRGSARSARRLAYRDITACGFPSVLRQLTTSVRVGSQ